MARFRKKPIEVEATQYDGQQIHPHVFIGLSTFRRFVVGKQGPVLVNIGDWIIAEPDGSGHYPCADDIFKATYEAIDDDHP